MKVPFPYLLHPVLPMILLLVLICSAETQQHAIIPMEQHAIIPMEQHAMAPMEQHAMAPIKLAERCCRIVFYNVENLFDIYDDSLSRDEDFTPDGDMHWNRTRYEAKLNNLSKVMVAAGGWQPADIIGLCEVENRDVLEDLTRHTILSRYDYGIAHEDSDDPRGIDVALLYNNETIAFLGSDFYSLGPGDLRTRDILHAKVILCGDTCHLFVNHWPSRSGGQLETEQARIDVARLLREKADSLLLHNPRCRIIIMGDFNDDPEDISISEVLGARDRIEDIEPEGIYNLAAGLRSHSTGTLKYQGQWSVFDQIMVSGSCLIRNGGSWTGKDHFSIFAEDFLLEEDNTYSGMKPFRTYLGYRYQGGFSDHLPVIADFYQ